MLPQTTNERSDIEIGHTLLIRISEVLVLFLLSLSVSLEPGINESIMISLFFRFLEQDDRATSKGTRFVTFEESFEDSIRDSTVDSLDSSFEDCDGIEE